MKRIKLLSVAFLISSFSIFGQGTITVKVHAGSGTGTSLVSGKNLIPELQAWNLQLNCGTQKPSATALLNFTNLIDSLVASGDWAHLVRFYVVTQENRLWWRVSLKYAGSPMNYRATEHGTNTWDGKGITSDGSTGYTDLNFYPASTYQGGNININAFDFGCWVITYGAVTHNDMGCIDNTYSPSTGTFLSSRQLDNNAYCSVNGNQSGTTLIGTNNPAVELQSVKVSGSTVTMYNKGVIVGTNTCSNYHIPTNSMFAQCGDVNGSPANFSTSKYAMFFIGDGSVNHANVERIFKYFATANGY